MDGLFSSEKVIFCQWEKLSGKENPHNLDGCFGVDIKIQWNILVKQIFSIWKKIQDV